MKIITYLLLLPLIISCKTYIHNGVEITHNSKIIKNEVLKIDPSQCVVSGQIVDNGETAEYSILFINKDNLIENSIDSSNNFNYSLPSGKYFISVKSDHSPYCYRVEEVEFFNGEKRNIVIKLDGYIEKMEYILKSKRELNELIKWAKKNNNCELYDE